MATEQLARFSPESPLHELERVNRMGAEIFTCLLFPRKFRHPEIILNEPGKRRVADFFRRTKEGIQITTRRDAENYDLGLHEGKFVADTGYVEPADIFAELGFDMEGETVKEPEVLRVDENVLPSAQHAVLTIGFLRKYALAAPHELPFINEFPYEGRRFWGRDMSVSTVYEMIDELNNRVSSSLEGDDVTNYDVLPAAQFFEVGKGISSQLLRKIYINDQIEG